MVRAWMLVVILLGACGSNPQPGQAGASSSLRIVFGSDPPYEVVNSPTSDSTATTLVVRVADERTVTLLSLSLPLIDQRIPITSDSMSTSIWAKRINDQPLIASEGEITTTIVDAHLSVVINVRKPEDSFGAVTTITGSIELDLPR